MIQFVNERRALVTSNIAYIISEQICGAFTEHYIYNPDLSNALSRVNMYLAIFQDNSAAKYYYKNDSIYFEKDIDFNALDTPAIHECLHFIQAIKNKNGKLKKLGLYNLNLIKASGLALNEAAVQLMASQANRSFSRLSKIL